MAIYGMPESGLLTFEKASGEDKVYLGPRRQTWVVEVHVQGGPVWVRTDGGAATQAGEGTLMLAAPVSSVPTRVDVPVDGHVSIYGTPTQARVTVRKIGVKF